MKKILTTILSVFLSIVLISPTYALSEEMLDIFDAIGSFYYNPEKENCLPSGKFYSSDGSNLTIIGDSIIEGAKSAINDKFKTPPIINAVISRTWNQGIETLKTAELKNIVIFALGTNTPDLTESDLNNLITIVNNNKTIALITNHTTKQRYDNNNQLFRKFSSHRENIILIDWQSKIINQEANYLASDGIHPSSSGQKLLADLIFTSLNTPRGGSIGNNQSYDGQKIFSDSELKLIERYRPIYQSAASKFNLPWQLLAVLHRREHSLKKSNPANGQGIYQLYSYTGGGSNANAFLPAGEVSDSEFLRQSEITAELVKNRYGQGLNLNTDDGIKTFFFRYNGTAKVYLAQARDLGFSATEANRGEGSPYVMNRADAKRDPKSNSRWGQIKSDGGSIQYPANNEFGAFVMFGALGGSSGISSCSTSIGGNKDINQTAIDLAWPTVGHGINATENYRKALLETGVNRLGDRWSMIGASCDAFVATVMRYSGVDKDFVCCGVSHSGPTAQYVRNSGKYVEIPNDPAYLKPGDIRLSSGHIEIYVEVNGVGKIASASHPGFDQIGARTGEILDFYKGPNFKAYRFINN